MFSFNSRNAQDTFAEKWISNSYLIRQSFLGYTCELGIVIFDDPGSLEIKLTVPLRIKL